MSKRDDRIAAELATIADHHRGILRPRDVVEFAKDPATALHARFTWSVKKAAYEYWLWQAREIITLEITVLPQAKGAFPLYVSLMRDRKREGGGYRQLVAVMRNAKLRGELLDEALADLARWRSRYSSLKELEPIFAAEKQVAARRLKRAA